MESLLTTIRDTTDMCDALISLAQRVELLGPIAAEQENFNTIKASIDRKIATIAASMESIESSGINQTAVQEINALLPGIIPATLPLNGFTRELSAFNKGAALEALAEGKAVMVSSSASGILAIIVKLFRWIVMTVKSYLKSRRDINRLGVGTTSKINSVGSINEYLLGELAKTQEYKFARRGFEWIYSISRPTQAIYKFNEQALIQWWPELINELEYEYNEVNKAFTALRQGQPYIPNIAKATQSPSMLRFFEALPQGIDRAGKIFNVEEARGQYQANPQRALFQLAERLRYMVMKEPGIKGDEFCNQALSLGRSIETYTNVDRLVFDQLNTFDTNNRLGKLEESFTHLYKAVQNARYNVDKEVVDEFVSYVNRYSEKLNCFVQLITVVSYLDTCSYQILEDLSKFTLKYVDIASSN